MSATPPPPNFPLAPRWFAASLCLVLGLFSAAALGDEFTSEQAVSGAKEVLGGRSRYPWYDSQADDARQIKVAPQTDADSANRRSKWARTASSPTTAGGG
ncbi:MAG: hypothetical protein SFU86_07280, partial [Pirellulaceae bacterium]|nr:hypothetical protein [Pirellulaceae bacterium]